MTRLYKFSKALNLENADLILEEIREMGNIKTLEYNADRTGILVETEDGSYDRVMSRAVNVFARLSDKLELSFEGFVPDDAGAAKE